MREAGGRSTIAAGILVASVVGTGLYLVLSNQCVKSDCEGMVNPDLVFVIVSMEDIDAGTELTPLLSGDGPFMEIQIPTDAFVPGAVTRVEQMQGMLTTKAIGANEMIAVSQLCPAEAFCQIGDAVSST